MAWSICHGMPQLVKSVKYVLKNTPLQGRSQGGRRGCASPWGDRAKTPAEATETLKEVTKYVRKPTKKHVGAVGVPLTIWVRQKNRAPVTIRGPSDSQSSSMIRLNIRGPLSIRGSLSIRRHLLIRGPLTIRGHPNCQGPL